MTDDAAVSCEGKERFRSFKRAQKVADRQAQRHEGERFIAYHCRHCDGFHVGTTIIKQRKSVVPTASRAEWEELDFIEQHNGKQRQEL